MHASVCMTYCDLDSKLGSDNKNICEMNVAD